MRTWLSVYLKGFLMGSADAVPGVSGGTIALITGIYDRLVDAVAGLTRTGPRVLAAVPRLRDQAARRRFGAAIRSMDLPFLLVLAAGVVSGALSLANLVHFGLENYRATTFAFFFGLIAASPLVLRDEVSTRSPGSAAAGLVGVVVAFGLSGLSGPTLPDGPVALFVVGAVVICAMVLPGVSGSLLLIILQKYELLTTAVDDLTTAGIGLVDGGSVEAAVAPASTLVVFASGAVVGLLTFARVVSWALHSYRTATMTFLVGLLVGALRKPAVEILDATAAWTPATTAALLVVAALGAAAVVALDAATGGVAA